MTEPTFPKKPKGGTTRRSQEFIKRNLGRGQSQQELTVSDQKDKIDTVKFNQNQLYGTTRRQVFLRRGGIEIKAPEIVGHIDKNWNDEEWLTSLLSRYGIDGEKYFFEITKTINEIPQFRRPQLPDKLSLFRKILLRLAGVELQEIKNMTEVHVSDPIQAEGISWLTKFVTDKIKESDSYRKKNKK